jgi:hypothetical protein
MRRREIMRMVAMLVSSAEMTDLIVGEPGSWCETVVHHVDEVFSILSA